MFTMCVKIILIKFVIFYIRIIFFFQLVLFKFKHFFKNENRQGYLKFLDSIINEIYLCFILLVKIP